MRSADNLLIMSRWASPSAFLHKIEVSSARSRESFGTSCSSVAAGSCHTRGPFLFLTGAAEGGLGGTQGLKVFVISSRVHAFSQQVPSLMLAAQVVCHLHLHPDARLVHELDMLVLLVACLFG